MLFTDFDASLMGRPPTAGILSPSPGRAAPPSLEEVISRIDISFEDDDDPAVGDGFDPSPPLARKNRGRSGAERRLARRNASGDAAAGDDADGYLDEDWDAVDSALGGDAGGRRPAFQARTIRLPGDDGDAASPVDAEGESDSTEDFDAAGMDWEAIFGGESTGEDADPDILALIPPKLSAIPSAGGKMKRRWVTAPPAQPYGGIERVKDWFQPPEGADGERRPHAGGRDWYEPPETAAELRQSAEDLFSDLNLSPPLSGRAAGVENPVPATPVENRGDAEDLFADLSGAGAKGFADASRDGHGGKSDFDQFGAGDSTIVVAPDLFNDAAEAEVRRLVRQDATPTPGKSRPSEAARAVPEADGRDRTSSRDDSVADLKILDKSSSGVVSDGAGRLEKADAADATATPDFEQPAVDGFDESIALPAAQVAVPELTDDLISRSESPVVDVAEDAAVGAGEPSPNPHPDTGPDDLEAEIEDYLPGGVDEANSAVAAPVLSDDDLTSYSESGGGKGFAETGDEAGGEEPGNAGSSVVKDDSAAAGEESGAAVDPLDVFANLDSMGGEDADGLDGEMRAMLAEDAAAGAGDDAPGAEAEGPLQEPPIPAGWRGVAHVAKRRAGGVVGKILPVGFARRALATLAFRENWRFYCDLIAALIATASLAVIISYLLWFR
jgi:hypothetical protein